MSLYDALTGRGDDRPSARRVGRKLGSIERTLTRESPELTGLFGVFAALAADEPPGGAEHLPPKPWPRPRPAAVAVLLALASVVALCLTLSTQIKPASRSCYASSAAAAAPGAAPALNGATATLNGTLALSDAAALNDPGAVNGVPCGDYLDNK